MNWKSKVCKFIGHKWSPWRRTSGCSNKWTPEKGNFGLVHTELKILPQYFGDVCDGSKTFEIRKNDREFKVGDDVILSEWHPKSGYSGRFRTFKIGYITDYEQKPGYVVFSIMPMTFPFGSEEKK